MKKILAVIFCVVMMMSLACCGNNKSQKQGGAGTTPDGQEATVSVTPTENVTVTPQGNDANPDETDKLKADVFALAEKVRDNLFPNAQFDSNEVYEQDRYVETETRWFGTSVLWGGGDIKIAVQEGKVSGGYVSFNDYSNPDASNTWISLFDEEGNVFFESQYNGEKNIVIDPEMKPLEGHSEEMVLFHGKDIRLSEAMQEVYSHEETANLGNYQKEWVLEEGNWYKILYQQDVTNDENGLQMQSTLKVVDDINHSLFCTINLYSSLNLPEDITCEYQRFLKESNNDQTGSYHNEGMYVFRDPSGNTSFTLEDEYTRSDGNTYIARVELFDKDGESLLCGNAMGEFTGFDLNAIGKELRADNHIGATRKYQRIYQSGASKITADFSYEWARDDYDMFDIILVEVSFKMNGITFYEKGFYMADLPV